MEEARMSELTPVSIDFEKLKSNKLDEGYLNMFAGAVKLLLRNILGNTRIPATIRGTPSEVSSFSRVLGREASYIRSMQKYGLNDPKTYMNKYKLDKAAAAFEKETGIKWIFR